jgi:HK97 family phage major capsid protein
VDEARTFRAKGKADAAEISFNDLKSHVSLAADSDKRFKTKRENGDVYSNFYVYDLVVSGDAFKAVICGPDYKMYEVDFTFDGSAVTLGESVEVEAVTSYEPVERSHHRSQAAATNPVVDSPEISEADKHSKNFMPKTVAELTAEHPDVITSIRSDVERTTRTAIENEARTRSETDTKKIEARNKEIRALADEMVKSHGRNWNGPAGGVYVVGERIRALEGELCAKGVDFDSAELRRDFKRRADEFIVGSREPKNPEQAAHLPGELASRCSLGRVIREGMKAADKGNRSNCFMIGDGAELEAHQEIHKNALEFPGGAANLAEGIQLPWNMPSGVRSATPVGRMKRDALAGDFATAGALIAPQYIFPTIELLRNFPALARAGMTVLSGVMGNLVLPRQESSTTAQSVAEGTALAQYDQVLGQIKMQPHRVGSSQKYSRLALLQTTPDFEAMVMADHMAVLALKIDYLGLNGQGAGDEPLGVLNQMIPTVAFAGSAANAFKNAVALETAVRKTNIYEPGAYITTSTARGTLRSTAKVLTGATTVVSSAVWEDGDTVNGRPAWDSQQVPGDVLVHGVFRHLVMAQWGGLAIVLDTISQANQDKYWLNINTYIDFALRHNSAISKSADSLATLS